MMLLLGFIAISAAGIFIFDHVNPSEFSSFMVGFFSGIILGASLISIVLFPGIKSNRRKIRKALKESIVAERGYK